MQRFISEDPIGLRGGINTYDYAKNSPTRLIDPFGLSPKECKDDDWSWFWRALCWIDPNCEPNVPPEFLPYIPLVGGMKGKEGSTDIPSWAEGQRPQAGESEKNLPNDLWMRSMDQELTEPDPVQSTISLKNMPIATFEGAIISADMKAVALPNVTSH
jgi:uncharacterized protein RhaS with RHS repeats